MAILNAESYSGNYIRKLLTAVVAWLNVSGIDVSREELRRRYRIRLSAENNGGGAGSSDNNKRVYLSSFTFKLLRLLFSSSSLSLISASSSAIIFKLLSISISYTRAL